MIGMALDRLLPAAPWQAEQVTRLERARLVERARGVSGAGQAPAAEHEPGGEDDTACAVSTHAPVAHGAHARMSAQMDWAQPSARWATSGLWAGVSFCSICTTLPFSIL